MTLSYGVAYAVTIGLEVPIVAGFYRGERLRMASVCLVATTLTHLAMHFVLPEIAASFDGWLLMGETGALLAEATAYVLASRKFGLGWALAASASANTASYAAGFFL